MWPFSTKKNIVNSGFLNGFTDWHCHILPGVDDGVATIEESLAILDHYEKFGITNVWFTPHIMEDIPNAIGNLKPVYDKLLAAYKGNIKLSLAAENMLDNQFEKNLQNRSLLTIGNVGDHVLVETSYYTPPCDLDDKLQRLRMAGYFPLLAHPERYRYMDKDDYEWHHSHGVKMQLNLSSLLGFYGSEVQDKANHLLNKGYYNAIGTDTHRLSQIEALIKHGALPSKTIAKLQEIPGIQ